MISAASWQFLSDLSQNNSREWFLANASRYAQFKANYQALIAELLLEMQAIDPHLELLSPKHCSFRIHKDLRFSKDKTPYKTHLGIWFNTNRNWDNAPGYYMHLEPGKSFIAGGIYFPAAEQLRKIRREIAFFHEELTDLLSEAPFVSHFNGFDRDETNQLKNGPKDVDKNHVALEFLKLKSFTFSHKLSDEAVFSDQFIANTLLQFKSLKPLIDFLYRGLETDE
jgi:uncharacterized protein (TIGR02453 family)